MLRAECKNELGPNRTQILITKKDRREGGKLQAMISLQEMAEKG